MMVCYTNQQEIPILPQAPAETENTRRASVSKKDGSRKGGAGGSRKSKGTNGAVKSEGIVTSTFVTFDNLEGKELHHFWYCACESLMFLPCSFVIAACVCSEHDDAPMQLVNGKMPLRRRVGWRANEREALRRGLLMFGLGRSEKVRTIMRTLLKLSRHGVGDIADSCWEFVKCCGTYAEPKEREYAEKRLLDAKDHGIEMGKHGKILCSSMMLAVHSARFYV